jgi:hypothetical protein
MKDLRRVVLLPLAVEGELRLQSKREYFTGDAKGFFEDGAQILEQPVIHVPDRQEMQLHGAVLEFSFVGLRSYRVSTGVRVQPYFFSL